MRTVPVAARVTQGVPHRVHGYPFWLFVFALVLTTAAFTVLAWYVADAYRASKETIAVQCRLKGLEGTIVQLDEVLTMSARMSAATGDAMWEERYRRYEPKLDRAIKEVIKLTPEAFSGEAARKTDMANIKLVEMEYQSFDLVRKGRLDEARKILSGEEYEKQKKVYAEGVGEILAWLNRREKDVLSAQRRMMVHCISVSAVVLPLIFVAWLVVLWNLNSWRQRLEVANSVLLDLNDKMAKEVSERERIQAELRETMQDMARFTSTASHELRTSLSIIVHCFDSMLHGVGGDLNGEQKEVLEMGKRNADRLSRLTDDILDYRKLGAGRMVFCMRPEDINGVIREIAKEIAPAAEKKGLQLSLSLAGDLPRVLCDKDRITQVLANLLDNALKFTTRGAVTVSTEAWQGKVRVAVRDEGIGISEENQKKLFRSFTRIPEAGTVKTKGTGLGLVISMKIAQEHGSSIAVESAYGKGAKFWFDLPVAPAAA